MKGWVRLGTALTGLWIIGVICTTVSVARSLPRGFVVFPGVSTAHPVVDWVMVPEMDEWEEIALPNRPLKYTILGVENISIPWNEREARYIRVVEKRGLDRLLKTLDGLGREAWNSSSRTAGSRTIDYAGETYVLPADATFEEWLELWRASWRARGSFFVFPPDYDVKEKAFWPRMEAELRKNEYGGSLNPGPVIIDWNAPAPGARYFYYYLDWFALAAWLFLIPALAWFVCACMYLTIRWIVAGFKAGN